MTMDWVLWTPGGLQLNLIKVRFYYDCVKKR